MSVDARSGSGDAVFARERQQRIAAIVDTDGRARVADLAAAFGVSAVTIRKDLAVLEGLGRVVRAHGGALSARGAGRPEPAFEVRERTQRDQKTAIAAAAIELVRDGDTIALDASTTALAMARRVRAHPWSELTVVTNGIRAALELAGAPGVTVLLPGGRIRSAALSIVDARGDGVLRRVNVQAAFVGAMGITAARGLTDGTEDEARIKRVMVGAAREVYALVDHTKWGRVASASFCATDALTGVITDGAAPSDAVRELIAAGVPVTIAREVGQ